MKSKVISAMLIAGLGFSGVCHAAASSLLFGLQLGGVFDSLDYSPNDKAKSYGVKSSDLTGGSGFALVASLDYQITPNWRLGPSYIFMSGRFDVKNNLTTNGISKHVTESSSAVLANLHYDFDPMHNISLYVGAGLGAAFYSNINAATVKSEISTALAWSADLGANYNISKNASLGLGYKYLGSGPSSIKSKSAGNLGSAMYTGNLVTLGLFYRFGV